MPRNLRNPFARRQNVYVFGFRYVVMSVDYIPNKHRNLWTREHKEKRSTIYWVVLIVLGWQTFLLMDWIPSKRENSRSVAFSGNGTLVKFNRSHPTTLKKVICLWNTSQSWTLFHWMFEIINKKILKYLTHWPGIFASVSDRATALNIERHSTIRTLKKFDTGHS